MRDRLTEASFDDFLSQEAQGPAVMAFWCIATRQCRDFGALSAINDNRTARTRRIVQTVQPFGAVAVAPSGDRGVGHIERFSHRTQGLAAIEFEQRGRARLKVLTASVPLASSPSSVVRSFSVRVR
jgi:hypothetical protein